MDWRTGRDLDDTNSIAISEIAPRSAATSSANAPPLAQNPPDVTEAPMDGRIAARGAKAYLLPQSGHRIPILVELEALYLPDIDPGEERCDPATLLDSVAHHIRRVDETTSRSTLDRYQYACAKTVPLLYNHRSSEGRNELLICKLFAVLFDGL